MLHVALKLLQAHRLADVERRQLTGRRLGEQFGREPTRQLVARRRQTAVAAVVDDATGLRLAAAVMLRLLLLPEVGRKLLHVLVADGALLLLLLALGEQLLELGVHLLLLLVLLGWRRLLLLLRVVWRLLLLLLLRRRLVGSEDGVSAAALLLLLELLHLLLELQVGRKGHLGEWGRVGWLLLLLLLRGLLLVGWLRGVVSSLQDWPALRFGHLRHLLLLLLLARVRLLQVPRNVSTGHSRLLLLLLISTTQRSLRVSHRRHSNRMVTHSRMRLLLVGNLRRRSLLLIWWRRRRMLPHEGTQVALLLLGQWIAEAKIAEDIAATFLPVGDRCVADGRRQLFVLLFGGHFAQHRGRREGQRSRGRGVLVGVVLLLLLLVGLGLGLRLLRRERRLVLVLGRGRDGTDDGGGRDGGGRNVGWHWAAVAWGKLLLLLTRGRRWRVAGRGRSRRCRVAGGAGRWRRAGVWLVAILLLLLLLLLALAVVLPLFLQLLPDERVLHDGLRVELELARRRNPLGHSAVGQRRQSHLLLRVVLEQQVGAVCRCGGGCRGHHRWGRLRGQERDAARARRRLDEDVWGDDARAGGSEGCQD